MPWLRLYTEIRHDRRLRRLPASQRWLWVVISTLAKDSPRPGWLLLPRDIPVTAEDLVDEAAISIEDVTAGLDAFLGFGMLETVDGVLHVTAYDKEQFSNDNSTERWRKWKNNNTKKATPQPHTNVGPALDHPHGNAGPTFDQRDSNRGQTLRQPHANVCQTLDQPDANAEQTPDQLEVNVGQTLDQHQTNVGTTALDQREANVGPTAPEYRVQSINKAYKNIKANVVDTLSASEDAVHVQNEPTAVAEAVVPEKDGPAVYLTRRKRKLSGWKLESFEQFWLAFNYKKGKAEAADAWLDVTNLTPELASRIIEAARKEAAARPALISRGQTPKWAQGWITGRRWEDWEENGAAARNQDGAPGGELSHDGQQSESRQAEESEYQQSIREAVRRFM